MLQEEHFAILFTFIKLPFVIKIFVLSILRGHFTQVLLYTDQAMALDSGAVKTYQLLALVEAF